MSAGKGKIAKLVLILLLIIPEILCKRAASDICNFIEIGVVILVTMFYLTDRPGTHETRRRVLFQDLITGEEKQGGVTIKGLEDYYEDATRERKDVSMYAYRSSKFGSPGLYVNYQFNLTTIQEEGPEFDDEYSSKIANFIHAGWVSNSIITSKVQIKGQFQGNKDLEDYLLGLRVTVNDPIADLDLELKIKEVSGKPNSWIIRLIFYLLVFVSLCIWCCKGKGSLEKAVVGDDTISYSYQIMNFFLSIAAIKMTFIYYFIGVFWFWSLATFVDLVIICVIWEGLKKSLSDNTTKIYLIVGIVFTGFVLLMSNDLFPFLVLYTYAGIHFDMAANKLKISKRNRIQFFSSTLYQAFAFFAFYNNGNPKYYVVSIPSMCVFIIIASALHILSLVYYERDPRDHCLCCDSIFNKGVKISKRNNSRLKRYVNDAEKDFTLANWHQEQEITSSNHTKKGGKGFGPGILMRRSTTPASNVAAGDHGVETGLNKNSIFLE